MILGLPWTSWLLLIAGVGIGLGISLRFYLAQRSGGPPRPPADSD